MCHEEIVSVGEDFTMDDATRKLLPWNFSLTVRCRDGEKCWWRGANGAIYWFTTAKLTYRTVRLSQGRLSYIDHTHVSSQIMIGLFNTLAWKINSSSSSSAPESKFKGQTPFSQMKSGAFGGRLLLVGGPAPLKSF